MIVLDNSVAVAYALGNEPNSAAAEALLNAEEKIPLVAPTIFWYEFRAVLRRLEREARVPPDSVESLVERLASLRITI